ncbi:MAG: 50S ribosomal protein L1 [Chlamydiae bacterium]|nr:50S ribosomal protein L1 [Chlamydiota bacterium]
MKRSKRQKKADEIVDVSKSYSIEEAVDLLQKCPKPKFDETVDMALKLGVDPKKADQQVRGTVHLPHGTGKKLRVVVFAKEAQAKEAMEAGADFAGHQELIDKINSGWLEFDAVVATPDMMREVGKLAKILGPRGLMPSPKTGSVTTDVANAVKEIKAGKVEFKVNKMSVIDTGVGKLSFKKEQLVENIKTLLGAIQKARPASAKHYLKSFVLSSTMGPGIKILNREIL